VIVYLRHPQYGTKVATLDQEVRDDEENGWERFDPTAPLSVETVDEPVVETKKKLKDNTPSFLE
jgi:hypothetical protein